MGKFVGLIGTISGKVGNVVFVKGEKGISYGRTYQPQVANPKTIGQTDQRAKMNLVGRMSQVTPAEVLIGLGGTKRMRRAEFNKMLLNAAVVEHSIGAPIIAKMAPADVIFSKGAQSVEATISTPGATTANSATIGLTLANSALVGKYGERIVVAVIDPSDKAGYSLIKYEDVVFDSTAAQSVEIRYGAPIADESMVCIYRIPYLLTEEGATMRAQTLSNDGTDIIAKVLTSNNLVQNWGNSDLAATEVFTQA